MSFLVLPTFLFLPEMLASAVRMGLNGQCAERWGFSKVTGLGPTGVYPWLSLGSALIALTSMSRPGSSLWHLG